MARITTQTTEAELEQVAEEQETRLMLEDPEAHFRKLKAQIKFRVVKKYQEDTERKKEEALAMAPVAIVKDRFGRDMPAVP